MHELTLALSARRLFEERRGKVLLGLCILSGGGLVISQVGCPGWQPLFCGSEPGPV